MSTIEEFDSENENLYHPRFNRKIVAYFLVCNFLFCCSLGLGICALIIMSAYDNIETTSIESSNDLLQTVKCNFIGYDSFHQNHKVRVVGVFNITGSMHLYLYCPFYYNSPPEEWYKIEIVPDADYCLFLDDGYVVRQSIKKFQTFEGSNIKCKINKSNINEFEICANDTCIGNRYHFVMWGEMIVLICTIVMFFSLVAIISMWMKMI